MADQYVTGKLAAIISVDLAGDGRFMEMDEQGTTARQKVDREMLIDLGFRQVEMHRGAAAFFAGDRDMAAGLLDEAVCVCASVLTQSRPSSLSET